MKKGLIFLTLFIVSLLAVLVVAPGFIDWNRHKPAIIAKLEENTGHDFKINGPLEFTILPFPKLLIEDLEIANGPEQLLTLGRLDVQVELLPLLKGNVNVQNISLIDPVINLSIDREGKMSWMTPTLEDKLSGRQSAQTDASGEGDASGLIRLDKIAIENGTLVYSDARNDMQETVDGIDLTVKAENLSGPFDVKGDVELRGQNVDFTVNSGRIEKNADTISLSAAFAVDAANTKISYSGVVGTQGGVDLQGEAGFETDNLAALMNAFEMGNNPALAKPVKTAGIFSYTPFGASYRNLRLSVDGQSANGSVSYVPADAADGAGSAAQLEATLRADKAVALGKFVPAAGEKEKAEGTSKPFIPQSITLPVNLDATIDLAFAGITYKDFKAGQTTAKIVKSGRNINLDAGTAIDGTQAIKLNADLDFGALSVSENTGAVTYSDPTLEYTVNLSVANEASLAGLVPAETLNAMKPYMGQGLRTNVSGSVTPTKAAITGGTANMNNTAFDYSGSYTMQSGRDDLVVNVQAAEINIDNWMPAAEKQKSDKTINVADYTQKLDLPFDVAVVAVSDRIIYGGQQYNDLQLKAGLNGKQLNIERAGLSDSDDNDLLVTGTVGNVVTLENISISVSGKTTDLESLLKSFKYDTSRLPTRVGAAELVSEFRGQPDDLAFTANVKALNGSVEAAGSLADMLKKPVVSNLSLRLRHPSYVEFARLFMPQFESGVGVKKSLDLFASMENNEGVYSFSELKALIGPSTITGSATIDTASEKPAVKLTVQADTLPLDTFLGHRNASKGTTRITPQSAQSNTSRWSREPIDVSWMDAFDLDLQATANTLSYGNWTVTKAKLDTVLNGGVLNLQEISGDIYDGSLMMEGELKQSTDPKAPILISGKTVIDKVQLEPFVQSFSGSKLVRARGPVSLNATFGTKGISQSDLVFNLQGTGDMSGENLVFEGFDLARLSRALAEPSSSFSQNFSRVLDASVSGGTTNFDTLEGAYDIQNGVVTFKNLQLTGPEAIVTGEGNVNLPLWTIDLTTNVNLREPEDAPVLKTVFKGPLDNPANTFGRNAMDQYFNKQIEGLVVNPLLEKLQDKGILPSAPQKKSSSSQGQTEIIQPESNTSGVGGEAANDNTAPEQNIQETPQQDAPQEQRKEPTPEDAIRGILEGVLGR